MTSFLGQVLTIRVLQLQVLYERLARQCVTIAYHTYECMVYAAGYPQSAIGDELKVVAMFIAQFQKECTTYAVGSSFFASKLHPQRWGLFVAEEVMGQQHKCT